MDNHIGLDFETYGGVNLPVHGLDRYVNDSTFTTLIASTYRRDNPSMKIVRRRFDFVNDYFESAKKGLREELEELPIAAHNAPFEKAVCDWLGFDLRHNDFIDSAVVARAAGAAGSLEAAAPQLLDVDKVEAGKHLMRLFSIPGKYQEANGTLEFDPLVVTHNPVEWQEYGHYCDVDAELGWHIVHEYSDVLGVDEWANIQVTNRMNDAGWKVDVDLVKEMQRRYLANQEQALVDFYRQYQMYVEDRLNFNSFPQLKKFCEARGIKAKSFDEEHVTLYLTKIRKRLETHRSTMSPQVQQNLTEVVDLLVTKQILGGSSLKKLQTILDQVGEGDRLRGQYLHIGAGQTWRTSGRGVQMQNLKQLREVKDMDELANEDTDWDNQELAQNLRQVFTASDPDGFLIVGDFSSVESRGLAYLAGAEWKLEEFRRGMDMYKVLAARIDGCAYDAVTKPRRQFGKVGELSCGYGAGKLAVQKFAKKMGTILTEGEAGQLVYDWREVNPEVVELWRLLDEMLHVVVSDGLPISSRRIGNEMSVEIYHITTPDSLLAQHKQAQSICVRLFDPRGQTVLRRYFHGAYMRGTNVCYYKPSSKKSGDVWSSHFRDPQTNEIRYYSIYGGKLSGILTQSMCREMFFRSMRQLSRKLAPFDNARMVGQFHDEIVVDWTPRSFGLGELTLAQAERLMDQCMSDPGPLVGFPLVAEIKHDYRYTK